jgi:nicotinate-nucleotide adenylyltransferase
MKIGLFGGSFNPPHTGHKWLVDQFRIAGGLDMMWVLVTPDPPHKDSVDLVAFSHRLEMTKITFQDGFGVEVNDIESTLPAPQYTYKTVEILKKRHPGTDFYLCLGEDSLFALPSWKEPDKLISMARILVARRKSDATKTTSLPESWSSRIDYIDIEPRDISSTDIREKLSNEISVDGSLEPAVADYIASHRLYIL